MQRQVTGFAARSRGAKRKASLAMLFSLLPRVVLLMSFVGGLACHSSPIRGALPDDAPPPSAAAHTHPLEPDAQLMSVTAQADLPAPSLVPLLPQVSFEDVVGAEGAKAALKNLVDLMQGGAGDPLQARPPKGVLLVGPPGAGKTMLAKATAAQANVPFFATTGPELLANRPDSSAIDRLHDLFATLRSQTPAILFIDEFDVITGDDPTKPFGAPSHQDFSKQLGAELDGFAANEKVYVIAAANCLSCVDKSLLRPGRFDVLINVAYPNRLERSTLLQRLARRSPQADDVDWVMLSRFTDGISGADLTALANAAAGRAYLARRSQVAAEDWEQALDDMLEGPEDPATGLDDVQRWRIAIHQAGHAMVAAHMRQYYELRKVSLKARGGRVGFTAYRRHSDAGNDSTPFWSQLPISLAGIAAQAHLLSDGQAEGQCHDLESATNIARKVVMEEGASETGRQGALKVRLDRFPDMLSYSEQIKLRVDEEAQAMLDHANRYLEELFENPEFVLATMQLATELFETEELSGRYVTHFVGSLLGASRGSDEWRPDDPLETMKRRFCENLETVFEHEQLNKRSALVSERQQMLEQGQNLPAHLEDDESINAFLPRFEEKAHGLDKKMCPGIMERARLGGHRELVRNIYGQWQYETLYRARTVDAPSEYSDSDAGSECSLQYPYAPSINDSMSSYDEDSLWAPSSSHGSVN